MINQSILYPMAIKTLTRASDSTSIPVVPGIVMSAQAKGTGTILKLRDEKGAINPLVVTEAVTTVVLGTTLFLVTPADGSGAKYIRAETVASFATSSGGTTLQLLSDDNGQDQAASLLVTESVATIQTRIDAAIIAAGGGGGGSTGSITATGHHQATAAQTTTNIIRITGGTVGMGIVLDTATAGELRMITNATLVSLFVYPAVGDFIEPGLVNQPIALGAGESIVLFSSLTGKWDNTTDTGNTQAITASGTVQGGGQIRTGVTDANIVSTAFGQTAVTLPPALNQVGISVAHTGGAVSAMLFPAGTDQIDGGGAGLSIFVPLGATVNLKCDVDGNWVYAGTQVDTLYVSTISSNITGGTVSIVDSAGSQYADFGLGITFYNGLSVNQQVAVANAAPGNIQINSNIFAFSACAIEGSGATLSGLANFSFIKNYGAEAAFVYCPSGHYMDGVLDGYVWVDPSAVILVRAQYDSGPSAFIRWVSSVVSPGTQSSVANAGSDQATGTRISGAFVSARTVATAGDSYVICSNTPREFTISNTSVNSLDLFPMVGGTINGGGVDAAFAIASETSFTLRSIDGLDWTVELRPGSTQRGTAFAGGGQANGTPIVGSAVFSTVASVGDSASIQTYSPRFFYIMNAAANALDLFPPVGGTINGAAVDAALSIIGGALTSYIVSSNNGIAWTAVIQ